MLNVLEVENFATNTLTLFVVDVYFYWGWGAPPFSQNTFPGGHGIYNFARGLAGQPNYDISFPFRRAEVEKMKKQNGPILSYMP